MSRRGSTAQTGGGSVDLSAEVLASMGSAMDVNAPGLSRRRSDSLASVSSAGSFSDDLDILGDLGAVDSDELFAWAKSSASDVLEAVAAPVDTDIRSKFLHAIEPIGKGGGVDETIDPLQFAGDYKSAKMAKLLNSVTGEEDKQKLAQFIEDNDYRPVDQQQEYPYSDMLKFIDAATLELSDRAVGKLQEMRDEMLEESVAQIGSSPEVESIFAGAPEDLHLNPSQFSVEDEDLEEDPEKKKLEGWRAGQGDPNAVMDAAAGGGPAKVHETGPVKAAVTLGATIGFAFIPFVGPILALAVGMSYAYNEMSSVGLNKSSMEFSEMEEQLSKTTEALKLRVEKGGFGAEQLGGDSAATSGSASLLAASNAAEGASHDLDEAGAGLNNAQEHINAVRSLDASASLTVGHVAVESSVETANADVVQNDAADLGDGYLEVDGAGGQAEVATASTERDGGSITRGGPQQGSISASEVTGGGGSHAATVEAARRGSANMGNGASTR